MELGSLSLWIGLTHNKQLSSIVQVNIFPVISAGLSPGPNHQPPVNAKSSA